MNLSPQNLRRLNELLRDPKLNLPEARRVVHSTGANYKWLQTHILERNQDTIGSELASLLNISRHVSQPPQGGIAVSGAASMEAINSR